MDEIGLEIVQDDSKNWVHHKKRRGCPRLCDGLILISYPGGCRKGGKNQNPPDVEEIVLGPWSAATDFQ